MCNASQPYQTFTTVVTFIANNQNREMTFNAQAVGPLHAAEMAKHGVKAAYPGCCIIATKTN